MPQIDVAMDVKHNCPYKWELGKFYAEETCQSLNALTVVFEGNFAGSCKYVEQA